MGDRFETLKAEKDQDSIIYTINRFVYDSDAASLIPVIGSLATWAPTTAVVIGYERVPNGPHVTYQIKARSDSYLIKEEHADGVHYKARYFMASGDSRIPVVGQAATWAPTTAYVTDFKVIQAGTYQAYEIEAKSINNVIQHDDHKGTWYSWRAYVVKAGISALPKFGAEVDWAPVDTNGNKAYLFDKSDVDMMGDGSFYVTMKACERKYDIGVEANL